MPPKNRKKGRGKVEIPMVCPESRDADEKEAAMMWDRVALLGPNPLSTTGVDYCFSTGKGFPTHGGYHKSVVGLASVTIPLIAVPESAQRIGNTDGVNNESFSGEHIIPGMPMVPKPPPRKVAVSSRLVQKMAQSESDMRKAKNELEILDKDKSGFDFMMKHEMGQLATEVDQLNKEIQEKEEYLREQEVRQIQVLDDLQHEHMQDVAELEGQLDELVASDQMVQEELTEKRATLEAIREKEDILLHLVRESEIAAKNFAKELRAEKENLVATMNQRLKKTSDDMAKLTAAQKEQRQRRAVSESDRLVTELSQLERRSRLLNDKNAKLTQDVALSKRDRSIEQYRRELLLAKNAAVNQGVKKVVQQLQDLEQGFAEKANKGHDVHGGALTSEVVDRQYEMIIHLRSELQQVRRDTEMLQQESRMLQRQAIEAAATKYLQVRIPPPHLLSSRGDVAGGGVPPHPPVAQLHSSAAEHSAKNRIKGLDSESLAACRTTIIESFVEVNKALAAVPIDGCTNLLQLRDPEERLKVQDYVAKRINVLFSNLYPTAPPAKFLEAAQAME